MKMRPLRTLLMTIVALPISSHASSSVPMAAMKSAEERCKAVATTDFSGIPDAATQVTETNFVAAREDLPAFCQVAGYITPNIGIELRLPATEWNGKFIETGCGGHCGQIMSNTIHSCDAALSRHYACISSDMGHKSGFRDGKWGFNNLQAKIDWGFRATHVTAVAGKAITQHYYDKAPSRSYYDGCSTGGRQGMQAAQRFPWDFDGIIAGAPAINLTGIYTNFAWGVLSGRDHAGTPLLSDADLQRINEAALKHCDLDDGVKDGIIGNPMACAFDPAELACTQERSTECLSSTQVTAVKKMYAGPSTSSGMRLFAGGLPRGSELSGWSGWYIGPPGSEIAAETYAREGFRYLHFLPSPGPSWKLQDFDFDREYQRLGLMESIYAAANPDLRQFKAAGGRLLVYQGANDVVVPPQNAIDYYETAEKTMGGRQATQDFFRLFVVPGMGHCGGGTGASTIDYLTYLEQWVEQGRAPEALLGAHITSPPALLGSQRFPLDEASVAFTRPIYPYPLRAKYQGRGDINDAASFAPVK
jgi:feruloyl esterase